MLSNRRWLLKLLLPILGFAAMCAHSAWVMKDHRPPLKRYLEKPDEFHGRTVWTSTRPVLLTHPEGFWVAQEHDGKEPQIKVISADKPSTGTYVMIRGTFLKPNVIQAAAINRNKLYRAERAGVYGVSAAVLAAWMWWFLRRFRLGVSGGLFHPRVDAPHESPPPVKNG